MVNVTFKDVGQGDSIIIEWEEAGIPKIGIIDVHICDNGLKSIPTLEHLKAHKGKYTEIEFIILSHPHYDHFSGMHGLLDYCEVNGIIIHKIGHTIFISKKHFYRYELLNTTSKSAYVKLIQKIKFLKKNGLVKREGYLTVDFNPITLAIGYQLLVLAPSDHEFDAYSGILSKNYSFDEEDCHNKANANLISTVLLLRKDEEGILLTSDCEHHVLEKVFSQLNQQQISLKGIQVPHHGALRNYKDHQWASLCGSMISNNEAIISVGLNDYGHPHQLVVDGLNSFGYMVKPTTNFISSTKRMAPSTGSLPLNAFSKKVMPPSGTYLHRQDLTIIL